jgi:hypothetical protein
MFTSSTTTYSQGMSPVDFGDLFLSVFLFFFVFVLLVCVIPFWKIFRKAGFPPALSLLMPIPGVNLVLLYILAFADWPSLSKMSGRPPRDPDPLL